jgi:hypothetical protein
MLACAVVVVSSAGPALAAGGGPVLSQGRVGAQSLTWAVVPSPNRSAAVSQLNGLSCASASACTAVGASAGATAEKTLIESWNGSSWSIVPSPNPRPRRTGTNYFYNVSCPAAASCTAVGTSYTRTTEPKTLIESWNGSTWSIVPSPNPAAGRLGVNYLDGVSCVSASACTAVGFSWTNSRRVPRTLIESWDGTAWTIVPSPSPGPGSHYLSSVSCISAASCTAVGYGAGPLIESWNGSSWSIVPSPNPPGGAVLFSVSCSSAAACMAVGHAGQTFAESWNGSSWSIVPTRNVSGATNTFGGVFCTSATACTAVGGYQSTGSASRTLVESWDGTAWTIVPSPNAGGTQRNNGLSSVSCPTVATCTAVGNYGRTGSVKTLIETGT